MTRLYKDYSISNNLLLDIDGNTYTILCISFFNRSGVVCCSTNCYLENNATEIQLPFSVARRAQAYDKGKAFLKKSTTGGFALFIPIELAGLKAPQVTNFYPERRLFRLRFSSALGLWWELVHNVKERGGYSIIIDDIKAIGNRIALLYNDEDFNGLPELIVQLQKLEQARQKVLAEIKTVMPDEIVNFYKKEYNIQ